MAKGEKYGVYCPGSSKPVSRKDMDANGRAKCSACAAVRKPYRNTHEYEAVLRMAHHPVTEKSKGACLRGGNVPTRSM